MENGVPGNYDALVSGTVVDPRVLEEQRLKKLKLDVAAVNEAVREYQAKGGQFEPGLSMEEILALLNEQR